MRSQVGRWPVVGAGLLAPVGAVPVVAVGSVDPIVLFETPWLRASVAFLLVVAVGTALLTRYEGLVDRFRDASMGNPGVSLVYGVMAHILVGFLGGVLWLQVAGVGLGPGVVVVGGAVVFGTVFLFLAGLGFAVVGTWLIDLSGSDRQWHGLVAVSALGAVGWLLPVVAGLAVWTLFVSVGIGGATREWVHAERTVKTEVGERR